MGKNKNTVQCSARRMASLESQVDLLEAELVHLNALLVRVGFSEGIKTLKETVQEVLAEQSV